MNASRASMLLLTAFLLIAGATDVAAQDDNMTGPEPEPDTDDSMDFMPFVVLIAFAAVSFLLAKYGP